MSTGQDGGLTAGARSLLDVRFRVRATRSLLPVLYLGALVSVTLAGLCAVIVAAAHAWWWGVLALLVVPPLGLAVAAAVRVACELTLAVSELNERVDGIADRLPRLERVIDDLARDMPKLGFRRRGSNGRERAAAEPEKTG